MESTAPLNLRPWNKGRLLGQKHLKETWAIRMRPQLTGMSRRLRFSTSQLTASFGALT
jgi:hypothetical protein